ncbi:hypothetical protein PAMP_009402 [Pampus punctatissimus]
MALSQIQCLDDNNVNPRMHQSKAEFFYCEDQRLALEALIQDGREAYFKYLEARDVGNFLSEQELETVVRAVEPYNPGSDIFQHDAEYNEPALSLHYWPDMSDTSIPQMDMGWPDSDAYRGVTRATVYVQPPVNGEAHIKEVVRRMIANAQKHLRVRRIGGAAFHTRTSTMVRGRMGHRFMFIDGDKAVSGSYSFTWMASRLDRNLITVVTGQAVETFDQLFCYLYMSSSSVDLRQVAKEPEPEPEPEPVSQLAIVTPPSAEIARKLYSPLYTLVAESIASTKESQEIKKEQKMRAIKEAINEVPPLHPGLANLKKVHLISYLPTWPEPDPSSDIIGFINIRNSSKPIQASMQRSEMFEISHAIRFSSPLTVPTETLPEVTKPRQFTAKYEEMKIPQTTQEKTKAAEPVVERPQPTHPNPGLNTDIKTKADEPDLDKGESLNTGKHIEEHTQTKAVLPHTDSHTQTVHMQPQSSSEIAPCSLAAAVHSQFVSSTSVSENNHLPITTASMTSDPCAALLTSSSTSCLSPPFTSSSTTPLRPLSSASESSSVLTPPIPKPRTVHLVTKDGSDGLDLSEISLFKKPENLANTVAHSELKTVEQIPVEKEPDIVQKNSGSTTGAHKDGENTGNFRETEQQKQSETSSEANVEETVGLNNDREETQMVAGTELQTQSDVLIPGAPKADSVNIQEIIPREDEPKTLMSTDCNITPKKSETDCVSTAQPETEATTQTLTGCELAEVPNEKCENVTKCESYHAKANEPQIISYCELNPLDVGVLEIVDSLKAPTDSPVSTTHNPHVSEDSTDSRSAVDIYQHCNPSVTSEPCADSTPNTANNNKEGIIQETQQTHKVREGTHTPEKPLRLHLSDTSVLDFRSQIPARESPSFTALVRTPTPDELLPSTSTSDSQTNTPDLQPYTPDSQTPTHDVNVGYVSQREDVTPSALEEFYECSDSPICDPVFDQVTFPSHGTIEDPVNTAHGHGTIEDPVNTAQTNTNTTVTSPVSINYDACASTSGSTDRDTSSSETQSLSGPARVSPSSSISEKKEKTREEEENANEEKGRKQDEKENLAERSNRTEQDSQVTERRGSEEAKKTANCLKQGKQSTETIVKKKENRPHPALSKSAEALIDRDLYAIKSFNEGRKPKRWPTCYLQPEKVSSEGEGSDKVTVGPSSMERKDRHQSSREAEDQKSLTSHGQQEQDAGSSSSPGLPKPLSDTQALGHCTRESHILNQAESKVLQSSLQTVDETSSPGRPPSRPPPPMADALKQSNVSHSRQSPLSQHPPATQGRTQNQHPQPKPHASSNMQQLDPLPQNQTVSVQEAQEERKVSFGLTFRKLYSLKSLKDKMKLPAQSKRSSTSSPAKKHKSTS